MCLERYPCYRDLLDFSIVEEMMKKSLIILAGIAILALASGQRPVHADLGADTMKCLAQTTLHIDGNFSEEEKNFLRETMGVRKQTLNGWQHNCVTPKEQFLQNVKENHQNGEDPVKISMIAATMANADGVVHDLERSLIEDMLEGFGKKRNAQPLLDLCISNITEEMEKKVNAIYLFRSSKTVYEEKRAEIPKNLKVIRVAEMAYESEYDVYVKSSAYPATPTKTRQQWNKSASGGFIIINFNPGDVRGSYMVSTTQSNFTATGISDVDGDGVYATYIATKSTNPTLITPPDVY